VIRSARAYQSRAENSTLRIVTFEAKGVALVTSVLVADATRSRKDIPRVAPDAPASRERRVSDRSYRYRYQIRIAFASALRVISVRVGLASFAQAEMQTKRKRERERERNGPLNPSA